MEESGINTIATHSCNTGYILNGDSGIAHLQLVKVRTKLHPVSCGPPPTITNGSPGQSTSTIIGGEATYTCDTRFSLHEFWQLEAELLTVIVRVKSLSSVVSSVATATIVVVGRIYGRI